MAMKVEGADIYDRVDGSRLYELLLGAARVALARLPYRVRKAVSRVYDPEDFVQIALEWFCTKELCWLDERPMDADTVAAYLRPAVWHAVIDVARSKWTDVEEALDETIERDAQPAAEDDARIDEYIRKIEALAAESGDRDLMRFVEVGAELLRDDPVHQTRASDYSKAIDRPEQEVYRLRTKLRERTTSILELIPKKTRGNAHAKRAS